MGGFDIHPKYHKAHASGEPMTIRGKTFIRRHEVYHLVISDFLELQEFQGKMGFAVSANQEKLSDITALLQSVDEWQAYDWWVSNYELRRRRWVRRHSSNNSTG